jgi:predicted dehydrogenase
MAPLRLGIIGSGLIWNNAHKSVIDRMEDTFLPVAFSARSDATREKVAAQYPKALFYSDYTELIAAPDVDAVVVLTPIMMNAPVAMEALAAGKHVFMEKPMASSTEEALSLVDAEARSGKRVFVLEQLAYSPVWRRVREVLESGDIGAPVSFEKVSHVFMDPEADQTGYGGTVWRQRAEFQLGLLFDAGIHDLVLLSELFGPPESVYARGRKLREEYGEWDHTMALFGFPSGVSGVYSHSGYLGNMDNYTVIRCTDGVIAQHGRERWTVTNKLGERTLLSVDATGSDHQAMWEHFARCLESGSAPDYSTERSVAEFRTFDAIRRSLEEGTVESIDHG